MRFLTAFVLTLYVSSVAFTIGMASCQTVHKKQVVKVQKHDTLPVGGFLSYIDTPTYTNDRTQRILLDFNQLGDNEAVIWGPVVGTMPFGSLLNRQITIKEVDVCEFEKDNEIRTCVGLAHCGSLRCDIEIKKGMTPTEYRQVLLHEYMHCMGFDDNDNPNDLMYHTENEAPEINIRYYAQLAAERQQTWKNLKNLNLNTKPTK